MKQVIVPGVIPMPMFEDGIGALEWLAEAFGFCEQSRMLGPEDELSAGVDQMVKGKAVSFFAPDEFGREVRFAFDMCTEEYARELAALLARSDDSWYDPYP